MSASTINYAKSNKIKIFPLSSGRGDATVYRAEKSTYLFSSAQLEQEDILCLTTVPLEDLSVETSTCTGYQYDAAGRYELEAGTYYVVVQTTRQIAGNKLSVTYYIEGTNDEQQCDIYLENINNSGTYKGQCPVYISTIVTESAYNEDSFYSHRYDYERVTLETIENRSRVLSEGNLISILEALTERPCFVTNLDLINHTIEFVMAGHYFQLIDNNLIASDKDLWSRIIICGSKDNRVLLGVDKLENNGDTETIFDGLQLFTAEPEEMSHLEFSHVMDPVAYDLQLLSDGQVPFASQCRFNEHGITHVYGGTC